MEVSNLSDDQIGREPRLDTKGILQLISENDPSVTRIRIRMRPPPNVNHSYDVVGRSISKNTNLRSLCIIWDGFVSVNLVTRLFKHMTGNQNIEDLRLDARNCWRKSVIELFCSLESFLGKNGKLKSFEWRGCAMDSQSVHHLMTSLTSRNAPLEKFGLCSCGINHSRIKQIMLFFKKRPHLTPKSILLDENNVDDKGCYFLSEILNNKNNDLEEINLRSNSIGRQGALTIATALVSRGRPLERLDISKSIGIDSQLAAVFLESFSSTPNLMPCNLILDSTFVCPEGSREFVNILARRNSLIESLQLVGSSTMLKFAEIFREHPNVLPKTIDLSTNSIYLDEGYFLLSGLLRSDCCSLERLVLNPSTRINDDIAIHFASSLKWNRSLRELRGSSSNISMGAWDRVVSMVCDTASIMTTYESNHKIYEFYSPPNDHKIRFYLNMNNDCDKKHVARRKVFYSHFLYNFSLDEFRGMQPELMSKVLDFVHQAYVSCERNALEAIKEINQGVPEYNSLTINFMLLKNNPASFENVRKRPEPTKGV